MMSHFSIKTSTYFSDCDVNEYFELISKLQLLSRLSSPEQLAVMAYIILFDNNDTLNVVQVTRPDRIQKYQRIVPTDETIYWLTWRGSKLQQ